MERITRVIYTYRNLLNIPSQISNPCDDCLLNHSVLKEYKNEVLKGMSVLKYKFAYTTYQIWDITNI